MAPISRRVLRPSPRVCARVIFRHQQTGKGSQYRKWKEEQRQRHPLEVAVLGHGHCTAAGIQRKGQRDQAAFHCLQTAGQQAASLHRQNDFIQFLPGIGMQRFLPAAVRIPGCGPQTAASDRRKTPSDTVLPSTTSGTSVTGAPLCHNTQPRHSYRHAHQLFDQLGHHVGGNPPGGQKTPPAAPPTPP